MELNPLLLWYRDFIAFKRPVGLFICKSTENIHLCPTQGKAAAKSNNIKTGKLLIWSRSCGSRAVASLPNAFVYVES